MGSAVNGATCSGRLRAPRLETDAQARSFAAGRDDAVAADLMGLGILESRIPMITPPY